MLYLCISKVTIFPRITREIFIPLSLQKGTTGQISFRILAQSKLGRFPSFGTSQSLYPSTQIRQNSLPLSKYLEKGPIDGKIDWEKLRKYSFEKLGYINMEETAQSRLRECVYQLCNWTLCLSMLNLQNGGNGTNFLKQLRIK